MSLRLSKLVVVPEETAQVARAAFPRGSLLLSLRDELGPIFDDQRFAALFPKLGQPAEAPWRLALVTLLQFMEGLSDCAAADTVRGRIDWKYVLALPLRDPGFHSSVLCEFRSRLITGGAERVLFDTVLDLARLRGLVRARGRQRTDATHVLAAERGLNRLACVTEAMRFTLEALAYAAPDWLKANAQPGWVERYERPSLGTERPPRSEVKRTTLAQVIGEDGHRLLAAVWTPDAPGWLRNIPAVEILRRIWVQQFYLLDGAIRWRSSDDTPPAGLFLNSPHDLSARAMREIG